MKKIKIIALVMAIAMLAMTAVACGAEKFSATCKISVVINGETILDGYEYTVEKKGEQPTVLQAVTEAFTVLDYPYATDSEGLSLQTLTVDGVDYTAGIQADGSGTAFWGYTIDGVEPSSGRAGNNTVSDGQAIVFTYELDTQGAVEFSSGEE